MSATYRDKSPVYQSDGTVGAPTVLNYNVTIPGTIQVGDFGILLVTWVTGADTDTLTVTGWTVLVPVTKIGTLWYAAFYRKYQSGDGSSISCTLANPSNAARLTTAQAYWWSGAGATPDVTGTIGTRAASGGAFVTTAPSITTTAANETVVIIGFERTTVSESDITSISTGTERGFAAQSANAAATCTIVIADYVQSTASTTPAVNITYPNTQTTNGAALQVALPNAAAPSPSLSRDSIQGISESDTIRVTSKTSNVVTGVRLAISTSISMTSPVFSTSQVPDGEGYVKNIVTGLSPDTKYYWQMELDSVLTGNVGTSRTLPTPGNVSSFSFLAASCTFTGSNDAVLDAMRTRTGADGLPARFFAHLGDVHYNWSSTAPGGPIMPNDQAQCTTAYETSLSMARQQALFRDIPMSHTWSDNDFCGSNSDSTYVGAPAVQAVWRKIMSYPTLVSGDGKGIYRSWVVGRVRFIQTDSRSYMSDKAATDDASKTMLGATQKQWLKDRLVDPEPVKIWLHDNKWVGPPANGSGIDYWQAFNTERTEIGAYILARKIPLLYIHGDSHSLSADTGVNNTWGSFPWACAAPMDQNAQHFPHTATQGTWPTNGGAEDGTVQHEYGWFDVTDNGQLITVKYTGYTSDGTARITLNTSWPTFIGWGAPI